MSEQADTPIAKRPYAHKIKTVLFYILIAAVILFPTILAVINAAYVNSGTLAIASRATEVVMYGTDGNELYREHASESLSGDTSLISVFNTIYNGLEEADSIPEDILSIPAVRAEILIKDVKHTLICHFPMDGTAAYCTNEVGHTYKINMTDSERFLRSPFAESLYSNASVPSLVSADGTLILPFSVSWNYRNFSGNYLPTKLQTTGKAGSIYGIAGGLTFGFDTPPTVSSVRIFEQGTCIFDGNMDNLSSLVLKSDSIIDIKIHAEWVKSAAVTNYGVLEYDFSVAVHTRAQFSLNTDTLSDGEFAVFTAKNITDISKLSFAVNGQSITPKLLLDEDTAYAIIPYSTVADGSDKLELRVSYGVSSYDFTININHNTSMPWSSTLRDAAIDNGLIPEHLGNVNNIYPFLFTETVVPSSEQYKKSLSFGENIVRNGKEDICFFTEYESLSYGGATVRSLGAGLVCKVGENSNIGKYVVVDMGLGLKLTYFGLSFVDTRVGAYLAIGDTVGKCGALSQDTDIEGFALMLSCGSAVLDAEKILAKN